MPLPRALQDASNTAIKKTALDAINYSLTFVATAFSVLIAIEDEDSQNYEVYNDIQAGLMFVSIGIDYYASYERCQELIAKRRSRLDPHEYDGRGTRTANMHTEAELDEYSRNGMYYDFWPSIIGTSAGLAMASVGVGSKEASDSVKLALRAIAPPFATLWHTVSSATIDKEIAELETHAEGSVVFPEQEGVTLPYQENPILIQRNHTC